MRWCFGQLMTFARQLCRCLWRWFVTDFIKLIANGSKVKIKWFHLEIKIVSAAKRRAQDFSFEIISCIEYISWCLLPVPRDSYEKRKNGFWSWREYFALEKWKCKWEMAFERSLADCMAYGVYFSLHIVFVLRCEKGKATALESRRVSAAPRLLIIYHSNIFVHSSSCLSNKHISKWIYKLRFRHSITFSFFAILI